MKTHSEDVGMQMVRLIWQTLAQKLINAFY